MGKRGPAPKGEFSGKSQVLSTRIRADTREALVAASKSSGRSLSQEIEYRLRRTFGEDERAIENYGNRRNFAIMRLITEVILMQGKVHDLEAEWTADPELFDQVVLAVNNVLRAIRPKGDAKELDVWAQLKATESVAQAFAALQQVDPGAPLAELSERKRLAIRLKDDLGDLTGRSEVRVGNADDFRRWADETEAAAKTAAKNPRSKRARAKK